MGNLNYGLLGRINHLLARMAQPLSKNHQIPELTANRDLCTSPRTCLVFNDNLYYYFKI